MGNSFIEAMAAKIPVIATQEGGLSDFIFEDTSKQTAWVCKKDDPESIVKAVNRIEKTKREDLEKYNAILQNSYQMVIEKYDWDIIAKEMDTQVFSKI
jgi:glycosyltransferase involved in cell wall biosynthesis